jgi:hypothetical protein
LTGLRREQMAHRVRKSLEEDELSVRSARPLIVIQRVQIPPDQSRADRPVGGNFWAPMFFFLTGTGCLEIASGSSIQEGEASVLAWLAAHKEYDQHAALIPDGLYATELRHILYLL